MLFFHLTVIAWSTDSTYSERLARKLLGKDSIFSDRVPSNINNIRLKMIRDLTAFPDKTNFDSDKLWFPSTACRLELYRLETVELRAWNREY